MRGWGLVASIVLLGLFAGALAPRAADIAVAQWSQVAIPIVPLDQAAKVPTPPEGSCSSGQKSTGDKANNMCPEADGVSTYYDKNRACGAVYDQARCSGRTSASVGTGLSQTAAAGVLAAAQPYACAKNKANCECGESQASVVVSGVCAEPHHCHATRSIAADGSACIYGSDCKAQCVPASDEGKAVYGRMNKKYDGSSIVTPVSTRPPSPSSSFEQSSIVDTKTLPPAVPPASPANTQPNIGSGGAGIGAGTPAPATPATPPAGAAINRIGSYASQVNVQAPSTASAAQVAGDEKFWNGVATYKVAANVPVPTTPTIPGAPQLPTTPTIPGAPKLPTTNPGSLRVPVTPVQNTFRNSFPSSNDGFSGVTHSPSFATFLSSFSPVRFVERASNFIETITNPPSKNLVVRVQDQEQGIAKQPTYVVVSPAPTVINIVTSGSQTHTQRTPSTPVSNLSPEEIIKLVTGSAASQDHTPSPTLLPYDQQALNNYLALDVPHNPAQILSSADNSGSNSVFTDPSITGSSTLADRAAAQQPVLLPPSTFFRPQQENPVSFETTVSANEGGHAISVVDLLAAITSGSFAEVRRALGFGGAETSTIIDTSTFGQAPPQEGQGATDVFAAPPQPETRTAVSGAIANVRTPPVVQVPVLPTPAWNPALGISDVVGTPRETNAATTYSPFPPLTPVPAPVEETPTTSVPAEPAGPIEQFFSSIGSLFRQIFGWLWGTPQESSFSSARAGEASVRLLADPPTAVQGTHTTLYWTSTGTSDCTVLSEDGATLGRGVEGTTLTPAISARTSFFVNCSSGGGTINTSVSVGVR